MRSGAFRTCRNSNAATAADMPYLAIKDESWSSALSVSDAEVIAALKTIALPGGGNLAESGRLTDIVNQDGKIIFAIAIDAAEVNAMEPVRAAAEAAVRRLPGVASALVGLTGERPAGSSAPTASRAAAPPPGQSGQARQRGPAPGGPNGRGLPRQSGIPGIAHIIAVASGKGGVGKSTTAANLALALAAGGLSVGLLDADIYGPSQPRLFGLTGKPQLNDEKKILPHERFGVKVMSIRVPGRREHRDDLARTDGDVGADADAARGRLERT